MSRVLILGATSDIAQALAEVFARNKYDLILAARMPENLSGQARDLETRHAVSVSTVRFDATDFAHHGDFCAALTTVPDVTITVFGYLGNQDEAQVDFEAAKRIIETNFTGAVSVLNGLAERYVTRGSGMIIGISSVAGDRGRKKNYLYGSAKAGFSTYLSGLRARMAPFGVHVMTVKPGIVRTRMTAGLPLPKGLAASPQQVARRILRAMRAKKNTVYTPGRWRWIMFVIRVLPEWIFKRLSF